MTPKDLPRTADALNGWIAQHFQCFTAPPRAYFELTFPVCVGFDGEKNSTVTIHRVSHLGLELLGREEDCCRSIAASLASLVTRETFLDAVEPLFIRTSFEWRRAEKAIFGRLAFWDSQKNRRLLGAECYKVEGALPREAKPPELDFNTAWWKL